MTTVISVEHLSKTYRLGQIGTGRFRQAQPDAFTDDLKVACFGTKCDKIRKCLKHWFRYLRGTL